jgi:hypothetical protein
VSINNKSSHFSYTTVYKGLPEGHRTGDANLPSAAPSLP